MWRIALRVEECCEWCCRPVSRCRKASCDDARTYSGVLLRGKWRQVDEQEPIRVRQRAVRSLETASTYAGLPSPTCAK